MGCRARGSCARKESKNEIRTGRGVLCVHGCVCVCWAGGKEMQFSRKNREPWTGFLDTEPEIMLSKPFIVAPRSLRLPHTLPTSERSGDPSRSGGGETSYFPRRRFCTRGSGQAARPSEPAGVSTAAAADPSRFPSPSFREAGQARGGRERPGWGEKGGELPACTLSSGSRLGSRLRVLLPPACVRAGEVEGRSLARGGGAQAGVASQSVRLRCLSLAGRSVTGRGRAPRRALAPPPPGARPGLAVPPSCTDMTQTHSHCSC